MLLLGTGCTEFDCIRFRISWLSPTTSSGFHLYLVAASSHISSPAYSAWLFVVVVVA